MHFNIYVDNQLAHRLTEYAEKQGVTRNALIREALERFITKETQGWPSEILEFKGIPDFPNFEAARSEFSNIDQDMFA